LMGQDRPHVDGVDDCIRVPAPELSSFVQALAESVGVGPEQARLLADLLVANDRRGVFSHGSRQIAAYVRLLRSGRLNPRPEVRTIRESQATMVLDGDGGLGYFPAWRAAHSLIAKARETGVAVAVTRNHGHFGAAGLYTRVAASAGLIGFDTTGGQLKLAPGQPQMEAAGNSAMSFAVPGGRGQPLVLDFGAISDLYKLSESRQREMLAGLRATLYRSFGLGTICQVLGGFMAGLPMESRASPSYPAANQGAMFVFMDPAQFIDPAFLERELQDYHRAVAALQPFAGTERATLPGLLEWERERRSAMSGIPVSAGHQREIADVAAELGLQLPWGTG
jgi:LDH2 family malate/lactate/ureidoglycolate dehydrogenase